MPNAIKSCYVECSKSVTVFSAILSSLKDSELCFKPPIEFKKKPHCLRVWFSTSVTTAIKFSGRCAKQKGAKLDVIPVYVKTFRVCSLIS